MGRFISVPAERKEYLLLLGDILSEKGISSCLRHGVPKGKGNQSALEPETNLPAITLTRVSHSGAGPVVLRTTSEGANDTSAVPVASFEESNRASRTSIAFLPMRSFS